MFLRNAFRATAVVVALAATTLTAACGGTGSSGSSSGTTLTVYSADGLAKLGVELRDLPHETQRLVPMTQL